MKQPIIRSAVRPGSGFAVNQKLSVPVTFSFMGHLVFFLLFILLPKISIHSNTPAHYINVQLITPSVSLPAATPAAETAAPLPASTASEPSPSAAVETSSPSPKASAAKTAKDEVSLASSKEIEKKTSMKKRTYKRERVMDSAIKNVEKQVASSQTDQKQQALDRIRSAVREQASQAGQEAAEAAAERAGMWGEGKSSTDIERVYIAEISFKITNNWAFSEQMAGGEKNLYNVVVIQIARSGSIEEIWFDRRSGNSYFDDSTLKAIQKSSPLPRIPDEIEAPQTMAFRFNPDGLK